MRMSKLKTPIKIISDSKELIKNKWFIFFRIMIPSLLLLTIIFALLTTWNSSFILNVSYSYKKFTPVPQNLINSVLFWKNISLLFSILSIIVGIAGFSISKNKVMIFSIQIICIMLIILLLIFSFMCIAKSSSLWSYVNNVVPMTPSHVIKSFFN